MLEVVLYALEMLEGMRRVLLCVLEAVEGELRLLEVLEMSEVMRCVLLRMLEAVETQFRVRQRLKRTPDF